MAETNPFQPDDPAEELPPVPEVLHSVFAEGPFEKCDVCGGALTDPGSFYHLQKTWKAGEVVFEIAVCATCMLKTMEEFSEESRENMMRFQQERYRPGEDLETCHFCGRSLGPGEEYELGAVCLGSRLARPPAAMCGDCSAKMQEDLSKKTKDSWGRFVEDNVPGVPLEREPDRLPMAF